MNAIQNWLADIWLAVIGFFVLYYAITDGFDLGVGIISLFKGDHRQGRSIAIDSIRDIWHGNQTWLVMLGGMLFGAFPIFYSLVLSGLYIPILIMLTGLIFRAASIELFFHSPKKTLWSLIFGLGSLTAALGQGFALGAVFGGLVTANQSFAGNVWRDWISPFSTLTAAGVLFGYTMLGANYFIYKTQGRFQEEAYRISWVNSAFTFTAGAAVYIWLLKRYPFMVEKWRTWPDAILLGALSLAILLATAFFYHSLLRRYELRPLLWNAVLVVIYFAIISVGLYPYMIPHAVSEPITVHAAAASTKTLEFMLIVTGIIIPVILIYQTFEYRTFRGKIG